MIEALLRGKLSREQENMEDILTSNGSGEILSLSGPAVVRRWQVHTIHLRSPAATKPAATGITSRIRIRSSAACECTGAPNLA